MAAQLQRASCLLCCYEMQTMSVVPCGHSNIICGKCVLRITVFPEVKKKSAAAIATPAASPPTPAASDPSARDSAAALEATVPRCCPLCKVSNTVREGGCCYNAEMQLRLVNDWLFRPIGPWWW